MSQICKHHVVRHVAMAFVTAVVLSVGASRSVAKPMVVSAVAAIAKNGIANVGKVADVVKHEPALMHHVVGNA
jgi:Zn finger protein HypA/HybF involved in hydrogenase expression